MDLHPSHRVTTLVGPKEVRVVKGQSGGTVVVRVEILPSVWPWGGPQPHTFRVSDRVRLRPPTTESVVGGTWSLG